jgi:flagellar motor switch protein FliM
MSDILLQEEIDALLNGMDAGEIEIESDEFQDTGGAKDYDFRSQERIVRRRIPTLEMINERLSKYLRTSLFKFLHRSPEVFMLGIKIQKFSEYVRDLHVPANLNIIRVPPLRGRALIVIDPNFIFTVVDTFFGGNGQFYSNMAEAREFTTTEMRVIQILIEMLFKNLRLAWEPIMELNFEHMSSEINPHYANIVGSEEDIVVISTLNVSLEGGGGDISIVMPYSMLEPIRALLDGIGEDHQEVDHNWSVALRNEVMGAKVNVNSLLVEKTMFIKEILRLKKGDVIPIDMPKTVMLKAEGIPVFTGKACASDGYYAVQIIDKAGPEHI